MTRTPGFDGDRLREILRSQHHVITCEQAYDCGLTRKAVDYRLRLDGPWQWLLPAVYVAQTGTITQDQRTVAALLYAGPGSVMTGPAAVRKHHPTCAGPDDRCAGPEGQPAEEHGLRPGAPDQADAGARLGQRGDPVHAPRAGGMSITTR